MTICRTLTGCLHPEFERRVRVLRDFLISAHEAGITKTRFEIFETFRSPERQLELMRKGTTKAGPFQSAHQFGLAVDFVPVITRDEAHRLGDMIGEKVLEGWSWNANHDWEFLKRQATIHGLTRPLDWDKCHIEDHRWPEIRKYLRDKVG